MRDADGRPGRQRVLVHLGLFEEQIAQPVASDQLRIAVAIEVNAQVFFEHLKFFAGFVAGGLPVEVVILKALLAHVFRAAGERVARPAAIIPDLLGHVWEAARNVATHPSAHDADVTVLVDVQSPAIQAHVFRGEGLDDRTRRAFELAYL